MRDEEGREREEREKDKQTERFLFLKKRGERGYMEELG